MEEFYRACLGGEAEEEKGVDPGELHASSVFSGSTSRNGLI